MARSFMAFIQHRDKWWIGWIEEIPGVNAQGRTKRELLDNLRSALQEMLEFNRSEAEAACEGPFEEVSISA
jgi:predicted RNase H-like HicB family nuclease